MSRYIVGRSQSNDSAESFGSSSSSATRRVIIRPLSTVGDAGKPSQSVTDDLKRVLDLIEDERHLVAYDLYRSVQSRFSKLKKQKDDYEQGKTVDITASKRASLRKKNSTKEKIVASDRSVYYKLEELLRANKEELDQLMKRAPLLARSRDNMDEKEGWTLAQTLFGITTYYRREKDGSLSIKVEGELKGLPLFEQLAVLREIDLHCHWAPFVTSSLTLGNLGKLDTVGWIMLGLPNFGIARDSCFRAIGCDCVAEDGSVLIVGRGVQDNVTGTPEQDEVSRFLSDDPVLKTLDIPPVPTRIGSGRMTLKMFEAKIKVLGPDHCHTYILANVNPNLAFIPQSLLEFVMKKLCGFLLNKLQSAAKKVLTNPVRNIHAQRMRDESAFYLKWLLPKFQSVAADHGWQVPAIAAFDLSATQKVEADKINAKRMTQMHSFSLYEATKNNSNSSASTHSAPAKYRRQRLDYDGDDSVISTLSGTSQSIWKKNPIATYLREIESRTQERKEKEVIESRRKATARLRPRALPQDKRKRLLELKEHKEKKMRDRALSTGMLSAAGLPDIHEHSVSNDGATVLSSQSMPYSPIKATLAGYGIKVRKSILAGLVILEFVALHMDPFLPTFSKDVFGKLSTPLQDVVLLVYIALCTTMHFLLCDVELIYAFETFELGMKTGDQVKSFYRGKVRFVVAVGSGILAGFSIFKAVLLSWFRYLIPILIRYYHFFVTGAGIEKSPAELETAVEGENGSIKSFLSEFSSVMTACHSFLMSSVFAVVDLQTRIFVRSNFIGRAMESLVMACYGLCAGTLSSISGMFYSLILGDHEEKVSLSWRDDAIGTLRSLLLYNSVFLLAAIFLLEQMTNTYRHKDKPTDSAMTSSSSVDKDIPNSINGSARIPRQTKKFPSELESSGSSRRYTFSSSLRRLKFRSKKQDDSLDPLAAEDPY